MRVTNRMRIAIAVSTIWAVAPARSDAPVTQAIDVWAHENGVVVSDSVRYLIDEEVHHVLQQLKRSKSLDKKYTNDALARALKAYLDNNLNGTRSPRLLTLTVEELSPGGLGPAYPTQYPVLTLTTAFELSGVVLNEDSIDFESTNSKKLLLRLGTNHIVTRGGSRNNCSYIIHAERGKKYIKFCPESQ